MMELTCEDLIRESGRFAEQESGRADSELHKVTDGKTIGTYLEKKFHEYLRQSYEFKAGSASAGIDFPDLGVDIKTTRANQPQSSCPFESARQKIYGLGYGLLIFVYEKEEEDETRTGCLDIQNVIYVEKQRTADFRMTREIQEILERGGNENDLIGFFAKQSLPVDDNDARELAREIMESPPLRGYLTISNALQWRLQYSRTIEQAGTIDGVQQIR